MDADPHLVRLLEKLSAKGQDVPLPPELPFWLISVYEGFLALSRSRTAGFSLNPLTVADIAAYLQIREIMEVEERLEWFELLKALDAKWFELKMKKDSNAH